ncbi:hypothetical protein [Bacillus cereus]|uniref:hypothetical protein n=1 Tax=Bacillus cereus TaxID=1396 RepID=UPI000B4BEC53|nr:hypothetical protein [Bacillus cereus]
MKIDKLEEGMFELIEESLRKYIGAWSKIPSDIDLNNLNIIRIRYVKEWGKRTDPEDGFIIEFSTKDNSYKELLGRSELNLTSPEYKDSIEEQNKNGLLFGKDITTKQFWYEYPVIWGTLDKVFDDSYLYEDGGRYEGRNYIDFGMRFD